jgi:hypothetical protein
MDELDYDYYRTSNKIRNVKDFATNFPASTGFSEYKDLVSDQTLDAYFYDEIGNITANDDRTLLFEYNALGLTSKVKKNGTMEEIKYAYTASGSLLKKQVNDESRIFISGVEYRSDGVGYKLVEIKTATGVVRPTPLSATNTTSFVYDIHIADHLGNVRVVLTEENAEEILDIATLEVPNIPNEEEIFEGIDGSGVSTPWDWPDLNLFNQKVAELKSDGLILGPSYLQPVELGEMIQVDVESFYREETDPGTPQNLLQIFGTMLVNLGLQGQGIIPTGEQGLDVFSDGSSAASQGLYSFLAGSTAELVASKPQSYLVYMFLGENLKINPAYSGIVQVGEPGTMQHLQMLERTMPEKGYFYTFVTNQSAHRVYYNNLKITRQRGTLRAMNNYYPFGLLWDNPETMPNATYQGKELQTDTWSDGSELALYDFGARMYDPVLGRWHCAAQQFLTAAQRRFRNASPEPFGTRPEPFGKPMYQFDSPYNAMSNNPVVNIDPDGMWSIPWGNIMSSIGGFLSSMTKTTITGYSSIPFMTKQTTTTQPNLGSGTAAGVFGLLLQARQDGKMIKDEAGALGSQSNIGNWFRADDNTIQFGRNVRSELDIKPTEQFLGSTYAAGSTTFNNDGSAFFRDETAAYEYMWSNSIRNKRETAGVISNNGILVLPEYDNPIYNYPSYALEASVGIEYGYMYSHENGQVNVSKGDLVYSVLAVIHTHPFRLGTGNDDIDADLSNGDKNFAINYLDGRPILAIGWDNKLYGYAARGNRAVSSIFKVRQGICF